MGMYTYIANSMKSFTHTGGREGRREYYSCLQSDCVEKYRLSNVMWWQREILHNDREKICNKAFPLKCCVCIIKSCSAV